MSQSGGRTTPGYKYDVTWKQQPQLGWVTRGRSNDEAYCDYCHCYINVRRDGIEALLLHTELETHQFIMNYKIDGRIGSREAAVAKIDLTKRAEILWCLHVAAAGYPYHTANITDLFSTMFVDSKVAKNVVVGRSKLKYEINKGLYPYVLEQLVKPVQEKKVSYVLHYEECITEARKRTLDIYVRYWHEHAGKVANVLIGSYVITRYDSGFALTRCLESLHKSGISLKLLAYVTCHVPEGDLMVFRGLNSAIADDGGLPMVEMVPFNESVIYKAYGKLLHVVAEWGMEDLVYDLRCWFNTCQEPDLPFVSLVDVFANEDLGNHNERFSDNRVGADTTPKSSYYINDALLYRHTLGLNKSFGDITANWPCLVKYFQTYVPASERGVKKIPRYQRLQAALSNKITLLRATFLRSVGKAMEDSLDSSIGAEGPSIHLVSGSVSRLVKDIGGRFLKSEPRADVVSGVAHIKYEERDQQLPDDRLNIGAPAGTFFREMSSSKLSLFYGDVRGAYGVLFGYLLSRLPITDPVTRGARCLNPLYRTDKSKYTAMKQLVNAVPQLVHAPIAHKLLGEWDVYQTAEIEDIQSNETVEEYWDRIFKMTSLGGVQRFGLMSKMVQVMLCIHYRPYNVDRMLRHAEHRQTTHVTHQYISLQFAGSVSDVSLTEGLINAYNVGWEKYSKYYTHKGLVNQAKDAVGSGGILGDGVNLALGADVTRAGFHGIREAEYLCSEGCRRIQQGIHQQNRLEVNGGIALMEECRSRIRVVRTKLTHREYLQELDHTNRQLAIGLYRLRQANQDLDQAKAQQALETLKRGCEGLADLRMDLRPDTAVSKPVGSGIF